MSRLSPGEQEFVSHTAAPADPGADAVTGAVHEIDARGISSPLHVLRAHRALRAMQPGEVLRVVTTSGQTVAEFQALAKYMISYELLSQEQHGEEFVHLLRKKR